MGEEAARPYGLNRSVYLVADTAVHIREVIGSSPITPTQPVSFGSNSISMDIGKKLAHLIYGWNVRYQVMA